MNISLDAMTKHHARMTAEAMGQAVAAVWFLTAGTMTEDECVEEAREANFKLFAEIGLVGGQGLMTYSKARAAMLRVLQGCVEKLEAYQED